MGGEIFIDGLLAFNLFGCLLFLCGLVVEREKKDKSGV